MKMLTIRKSRNEDMQGFADQLERELGVAGLEFVTRLGLLGTTAGPRFPGAYGFESKGQGGFSVEYVEDRRSYMGGGSTAIIHDATLIPIGASDTVVRRVYDHLRNIGQVKGHEVSEFDLK